MTSGSWIGYRGPMGPAWSLLALVIVASLALVAPTNGLCYPEAHELMPIHPLFSHDHDPHAAHRSSESSPPVVTTTPVPDLTPVIAPVGAVGPSLGLASTGMDLGGTLALLLLAVMYSLRVRRHLLVQQAWVEVPTGPPR